MRKIYSRIPTADSGDAPVPADEKGMFQRCGNSNNVTYGFEVLVSPPPAELVLFPRGILENTRDAVTLMKEGIPSGDALSMSKTRTLAYGGKDSSRNWKTDDLGGLGRDDELTSSNLGDSPQATHLEGIEMTSPSAWLTSEEVSPISKQSSPVTFLGIRNGSSIRCYHRAMKPVGILAEDNIRTQDGEIEIIGNWPTEKALSLSENDCPIPAFRFARNSHEPGNSFVSPDINFETPRVYPFPFPPAEDVPTSLSHGEIPPNSLVFVQDPQYADRPAGVHLGYQFPQIPRNNPILPYLHAEPLCPATGRPPIPNLVETTQAASGSLGEMDVPRSWWHYFYCNVVPSHLFQNDRQPSLDLPELDHWSVDVEPAMNTRPPSLMKETYRERQEKRLKRAICNRWIRYKLEQIRNFVVTGPKMAAAIILWVFRWCGLDKSHAGWYG